MKLIPAKSNSKDPVILEYKDGTRLLFSYETPVAAYIPDRGFLVTDLEVSPTTARRIKDWVRTAEFIRVPQSDIFKIIVDRPVVTRENL